MEGRLSLVRYARVWIGIVLARRRTVETRVLRAMIGYRISADQSACPCRATLLPRVGAAKVSYMRRCARLWLEVTVWAARAIDRQARFMVGGSQWSLTDHGWLGRVLDGFEERDSILLQCSCLVARERGESFG